MSRADIALRDAVALQARLRAEGRHRDAEIVRALCHSYRGSRATNRSLHADNMALRGAAGLVAGPADVPPPEPEMDWPSRARAAIAAIHASLPPDAPYSMRVSALKRGYPFGERRYWPYAAWLEARRTYLRQYDPATPLGPLFVAALPERLAA